MRAGNIALNALLCEEYLKDIGPNIHLPTLFILGKFDAMISNAAVKREMAQMKEGIDKDLIMYNLLDHNPHQDAEFLPRIAQESIAWFDKCSRV